MENIQIQTAQNVAINYEIASLGDRMAAFCIDYFGIKLGYIALWYAILSSAPDSFSDNFREWQYVLLFVLPLLMYDVLMEIFNNGQSLGKRAMKIKVVMLDGSQPSIVAFLLRWVFRMVELDASFGSLALWFYLFSARGQRLGDLAAGTTVVKLREELFSATIFENLHEQYQPVYSEALHLQDAEAGLIREILEACAQAPENSPNFAVIAAEAQKRIVARLKIETSMEPLPFLDTMLKDYNHLHAHTFA